MCKTGLDGRYCTVTSHSNNNHQIGSLKRCWYVSLSPIWSGRDTNMSSPNTLYARWRLVMISYNLQFWGLLTMDMKFQVYLEGNPVSIYNILMTRHFAKWCRESDWVKCLIGFAALRTVSKLYAAKFSNYIVTEGIPLQILHQLREVRGCDQTCGHVVSGQTHPAQSGSHMEPFCLCTRKLFSFWCTMQKNGHWCRAWHWPIPQYLITYHRSYKCATN